MDRRPEKQSCESCKSFSRQHPQHEFGFCTAPLPFWVFVEAVGMPSNFVRMDDGANCPAYQPKEEIE